MVLCKQHLTDDSKISDIAEVVKDINGLHSTDPATPYLSLFSRTKNFTKDKLDEELYIKKTLGKIRCVRKTVYILPKEIIPIAFAATNKMVELNSGNYSRYLGVSEKDYRKASEKIIEILENRGMTTKEIKKELKTKINISPIINLMCDRGLLIRGASQNGWRSNIHTYYLFEDYFPDLNLSKLDEKTAKRLMVENYLSSFGPVTENDICWWTGFLKREVKEMLEDLKSKIEYTKITNLEGVYIFLSSNEKILKKLEIPQSHIIIFLPRLDPYLMGYKDRQRYLDYRYYNKVFDRSGNATSTILVDGRVAGVWDFEEGMESVVKIHLFDKVEKSTLKQIFLKAKELGKFIAERDTQIKKCDSMIPLNQRTAGGFMSPLKGC